MANINVFTQACSIGPTEGLFYYIDESGLVSLNYNGDVISSYIKSSYTDPVKFITFACSSKASFDYDGALVFTVECGLSSVTFRRWILDLDKTEEELLYGMRKTTRYLIRQAQKNSEIQIKKSQSLEDLEEFYKIYQETASYHHFVPFSFDYLKKELETFKKDDQILIFLAKYKGEVVSGAVIVYWQNGGFYHHGASLRKYSKVPASYLIQWEAIKEAKKRECDFYSFWGIAPEDRPNHPWKGLTLFKKGFGGKKEEYVKTKDYVLSWRYKINWIVETLRKIKRGYC